MRKLGTVVLALLLGALSVAWFVERAERNQVARQAVAAALENGDPFESIAPEHQVRFVRCSGWESADLMMTRHLMAMHRLKQEQARLLHPSAEDLSQTPEGANALRWYTAAHRAAEHLRAGNDDAARRELSSVR